MMPSDGSEKNDADTVLTGEKYWLLTATPAIFTAIIVVNSVFKYTTYGAPVSV